MKRINILILVFIIIFIFTSCGTEKTIQSNDDTSNDVNINNDVIVQNDNIQSSPETVMDLFDGERRIWYFIDRNDAEDGLTYDNEIQTIFVTENKKVVEAYYNLNGIYTGNLALHIDIGDPNPLSNSRLKLEDLVGLSDDEIICMVQEKYADVTTTYDFDFNFDEGVNTEVTGSPFVKQDLPFKIIYDGELDSSGNNLENEKIKFLDKQYVISYRNTDFNARAQENMENVMYFDKFIKPTVIKDKEYVGIEGYHMLITLNNYDSVGLIKLDDPSGITDF